MTTFEPFKENEKGERVRAIQEKLQILGFYVGPTDGIYTAATIAAIAAFQRSKGLSPSGKITDRTLNELFRPSSIVVQDVSAGPALPDLNLDIPRGILVYHSYMDSVNWRLTMSGVEIEGSGIERTAGEPKTVRMVWDRYGEFIEKWGSQYRVPCELIVAAICTESSGDPNLTREEPGYVSDEATPGKVSYGLMQTLLSTARDTLNMQGINREWLFVPENSIQAGTSYIRDQRRWTELDPPTVACAYNAGGVYYQDGLENRWKMRQFPIGTSKHADRFVKWLNDFFYLIAIGEAKPQTTFFA